MSGTGDPLLYEVRGPIAWITLNRPEKRNALSRALIEGLREALRRAADDGEVRVVAMAGAGNDFCAGADLGELGGLQDASVAENLDDIEALAGLILEIRALNRPVVAVVHGRALAGGCGLASACDLVLAREDATFGYPEVRIGFVPAMVMAILRRNVSEKRAFELIALGRTFGAAEAERYGLVNRVFPHESFEDDVREVLLALASRSSSALALGKRLLYQQDGLGFEAAVRAGVDVNALARTTEDTRSGVRRFLDKSPEPPTEGSR
ncbi:MAG: enoyl-CoA hydratase-related protein [Gemmatimonadota bacterium]